MTEDLFFLGLDELEDFMRKVLLGLKVPKHEADITADVLITADRRGIDSHGIGRLKPIYYDRIKAKIQNPTSDIMVIKEGPTTTVLDGNNGMGQYIAYQAMQMAIEKAKKFGLGMTVVRNSTHYGICGYYLLQAIKEGMIGITGTNARPSIAPTFGVENMLGTNPLTFGFPTDEDFPFVLDCATSITQRGKIEVYERENQDIPAGWVIGNDGSARTDTKQILLDLVSGYAALTPLGGIGEILAGYKGYGYATAVEILSAALQDGSYLKDLSGYSSQGEARPYRLGHFFIAIDISSFIDVGRFKTIAGSILKNLRNSKRADPDQPIYTAGEKEYIAEQSRIRHGVPINKALQKDMLTMREELGLSFPLPFN